MDIELRLYIPNPREDFVKTFLGNPRVRILSARVADMGRIQSEADILYLPLSWNTPSTQIIATASPLKLSEYLVAGRPILIHAPSYSFISRYAKAHKFACIIDEDDISCLKKGINRLLTDFEYSENLVKNAYKTFHQNHNAIANSRLLQKIIDDSTAS